MPQQTSTRTTLVLTVDLLFAPPWNSMIDSAGGADTSKNTSAYLIRFVPSDTQSNIKSCHSLTGSATVIDIDILYISMATVVGPNSGWEVCLFVCFFVVFSNFFWRDDQFFFSIGMQQQLPIGLTPDLVHAYTFNLKPRSLTVPTCMHGSMTRLSY